MSNILDMLSIIDYIQIKTNNMNGIEESDENKVEEIPI
jgi:hypothetical protein